DAGNYTFNTTASTSADITPRTLTISEAGRNEDYDGTATATVTLSDNRVAGDVFTDSYTAAAFNNKNAGTSKPVSVSGISICGTGENKVYDGSATATVSLSDNRLAGDVFTDSYTSAAFNNKNAGTSKPVSVSGISISGADAGNYTFNTTASTSADITPRTLTISAAGQNKVYDGTATATVTLSDDRVSGDSFSDSYTSATFADKNVSNGKSVSVADISISG